MNERSRPAKAAPSLAGDTTSFPQNATARRYWARQLIERQTPDRPRYGSTAWLMLPNEHPDKIAACVVAAECWESIVDTLEDDLQREIEQLQIGHKKAEDLAYLRSFARHIKSNGGKVMTSFEERRRRQLEAAKPRPDDYKGGPLAYEWDRGDGA